MSDKRAALTSVFGKIAKLIPLLASDKSGEVVNAAGRLVHTLASAKLDLHDLVSILKQESLKKPAGSLFETDSEILLRLALASAKLFHTSDKIAYADVVVDGHRKTWPVKGGDFSNWLLRQFFVEKKKIPTITTLKTVVHSVNALAIIDSDTEQDVHLRVAQSGDRIYLDLADEEWRAIEIDSHGWRLVSDPPVRFRRTPAMRPLPVPERGGSIGQLRSFVNLSADDFVLFVAMVLNGLRSGRPHPVLYLVGGEGTAKTTLTEIAGRLIDPSRIKPRRLPGVEDLFVSAYNKHLLCFENISVITEAVSDALCQISSGTSSGKRKKFTDSEEFVVGGSHPLVLNGLVNCINKADLADRTVVLNLPRIENRRLDVEFWNAFGLEHPKILGALLDAAVHGLSELPKVVLQQKIRMADFEIWAVACEAAFTEPGSFQRAFKKNVGDTVADLVDDNAVAKAVASFMISNDHWKGTIVSLLNELTDDDRTEAKVTRSSTWPREPAQFGKALRSTTATLRKMGIEMEFGRSPDRRRTRTVNLRNLALDQSSAKADGADSAHTPAQGSVVSL